MNAPAILVVDPAACTACRACEIACHYHHSQTFGTSRRSIHILFDSDSGSLQVEFDSTCDACFEEPAPQCAAFCTPGALRRRG